MMTNELSTIEERAGDILKDHNGVYLDKRLYTALKKEFPGLSRKDFQAGSGSTLNQRIFYGTRTYKAIIC